MARPKSPLPPREAITALIDVSDRLAVRVTPGARSDAIALPAPDSAPVLTVRVTAAPENGKANAAVVKLLAKALGLPQSRLTIVKGDTGRDKIIAVQH